MPETVTIHWHGAEVVAETREAGLEAVKEALDMIAEEAKDDTPIATGALRDSQRVDIDPATLEGVVTYDASYAQVVHENTLDHHEVGEAKWLQKTMERLSGKALEMIRARLAEVIR